MNSQLFFYDFVILFEIGKQSEFHLTFFQTVGELRDFTVVTKLIKNFKSFNFMVFLGGGEGETLP